MDGGTLKIGVLWCLFALMSCSVAFGVQLSGRVYQGSVGDEGIPLGNVPVKLYASQDAAVLGTKVGSTKTDASGWYGLEAPAAYEFYTILAENLAGYVSVGATSVDGAVKSADQIQYSVANKPLADQTLTGNKFWDKKSDQEPPNNRAPVAKDDGYGVSAGGVLSVMSPGVLGNDGDADGDPLTAFLAGTVSDGTLTLNNNGSFVYTPNGGFSGTDTFTYKANDGLLDSNIAKVTITVDPGNEPPDEGGTIRGAKFNDLNGNGQRDPGEPGLPGWTIRLLDAAGNTLATTTTDANGNYTFTDLAADAYHVEEVQQTGWRQTVPEVDGQPATWAIGLEPGAIVEDIDFGNVWEGTPMEYEEEHGDAPLPYGDFYLSVSPTALLGARVDGEPAMLRDPHALGDDNDGDDDEDGVEFITPLIPGQPAKVRVDLTHMTDPDWGVRGYIDFDRNGVFDLAESVLPSPLTAGIVNETTFTVPSGALTGTTFARFYAYSGGPEPPWGLPYGEVEDYEVVIGGDGPEPYVQVNVFGMCLRLVMDVPGIGLVQTDLSGPAKEQVFFDGPTGGSASDDDLNGLDEVDTELIDLRLTGLDPVAGSVVMRLNAEQTSAGQIEEQANGTPGVLDMYVGPGSADSFFDVYIQIDLPDLGLCFRPAVPIRLAGVIDHLPVATSDVYAASLPADVELFKGPCMGLWPALSPPADAFLRSLLSCQDEPPDGEFDFGDAPDSYKTLHNSGGPYHDVGAVRLGNLVDGEADGQPTPAAAGDDNNGDDEDGFALVVPPAVGGIASVKLDVTAPLGVPAAVAVWIDFDHSGTFDDPGERVVSGIYTGAGSPVPWTETFSVPPTALGGETYVRCRIYRTEQGVDVLPSPTGYGAEGEVEDHRIYILSDAPGPDEPLDFGDAPSPYPDASHTPSIVWLGNVRPDAEAGTQPIPPGLGDDNNGTDDEDGVTFLTDLVPGQPFGVTVKAYVNGVSGLDYYGWVDYNRDGDWDDPGEFLHSAGSTNYSGFLIHTCTNPVPATAVPGKTYARFRVYEGPGSGAPFATGGYGGPGEVEDYEVEIKLDGDFVPPGAIFGGVKFNDLNGNGTQDPGEPGLANWTIWIDLNGNGVKDVGESTLSNPDGSFYFMALAPGTYNVYEEMQSGWTQTYPGGSGVHTVVIQAGQAVPSIAFGNRRGDGPAPGEVIHGYKWNDLDGDGLWDVAQPIEPALPGWTIWLDMNGNGVQDAGDVTTMTDAIGHFVFPPVPAGTYVLGEVPQAGWTQTAPAGGTHTVTVQGGQGSIPLLFGNRQDDGPTNGGTICGNKWNDLNGDAVPDAGEPGLANWTVYLDVNQNGQLDAGEPTRVTDAAGNFEFTGLAIGAYVLAEQMQAGWTQTWPGGIGTHAIGIQPGMQPACVMFGNWQGKGPGPDRRWDWGDAPDPSYPTLNVSNGARHIIVPGFFLGGTVDGEPDGQPSPDAGGDGFDEDGVAFLTPLIPGQPAMVEVVAPAAGRLDAWIDFEADGSWTQTHDRVCTGYAILPGSNVVTFMVPAGAAAQGDTFARFRLSTQGAPSYDGPASDGEVEDYHLLLGPEGPGVPGEGPRPHVKWSQPPIEIDPNVETPPVFCGWAEPARSTEQSGDRRQWRMAADDFHCLGPIPVTRIRWWGSYKAWARPELPENEPMSWHIGFWANDVEGLDPNALYPRYLVWSVEVPHDRVRFEPVGRIELETRLPETVYAYELALEPGEWFHQGEFASNEDVFWISITAVYAVDASVENNWAWTTRPHLWGRGAVTPAIMGDWPTPDERLFPGRIYPVESTLLCGRMQNADLCFELLTDEPWIKWDQPFTGIREWPGYTDDMAMALEADDGDLILLREVADDWLCERADPVIALSWQGSYLGYGYEACQCVDTIEPRRPDYFLLSIYTDAPPDQRQPYNHPGEKIWTYEARDYDEVLVGYDRNPEGEPNEPVFRYSVRLPERSWFHQDGPGTVHWLSIMAVFKEPTTEIPYQWGWTSHRYGFGTSALVIDYRLRMMPQWREQFGPIDEPVDRSFTLFSAPELPPPE